MKDSGMDKNAASQQCQPSQEPARHTATPWAYRPARHDDWGWIRGPQPDNGEIAPLVAIARSGEWETLESNDAHRAAGTDPCGANAAFIVEAVNSHASLKEQIAWWEDHASEQAARIEELSASLAEMIDLSGTISPYNLSMAADAKIQRARASLPQPRAVARRPG